MPNLLGLIYARKHLLGKFDEDGPGQIDNELSLLYNNIKSYIKKVYDDPPTVFGLTLLAMMNPKFVSFGWLKRLYSNEDDWPTFTSEYPT